MRGSIFIIMNACTSTSELDIEISSIEYIQVITGSEVVSAADPYHSKVYAKFSPNGIILGGQFMSA